jgi:hypothetical protein
MFRPVLAYADVGVITNIIIHIHFICQLVIVAGDNTSNGEFVILVQ